MPTDTMGSMAAEVTRWLRGDLLDDDGQMQIRDAINNAVESIWTSMMQVQLSKLMGPGPVSFTLAAGVERYQIISIFNPLLGLTFAQVAGGALAAGRSYFMVYTLVSESGSETLPSPVQNFVVLGAGQLATLALPAGLPGNAFGWNLYVGSNLLNMALQNQQPLPFGPVITERAGGFQPYPDSEQIPPTVNSTADDIAYINHLEIQNTDKLWRSWNQASIDSAIMRRLARTFPTASEYQTHGWDLINGSTLEIRPATGVAIKPRYFYVRKPRRIAFDTVDLPSQNVVGMHEFVHAYSMEQCKMGLEEGGSSTRWAAKAKDLRQQIILALNQEGWAKNTRVSPFMR